MAALAACVFTRGISRLTLPARGAGLGRGLARPGRPASAQVTRQHHGGRIGGLPGAKAGLRWRDGGPVSGQPFRQPRVTWGSAGFSSSRRGGDGGTEPPAFAAVARDDAAGLYRVTDDRGRQLAYPYVWLRDNCRCPSCHHPSSWQRARSLAEVDPEIVPASQRLDPDGRLLSVDWPDGHRSDYPTDWLHRLGRWEATEDPVGRPRLVPFGHELSGGIPTFAYDALLRDDWTLHDWLHTLNTLGLALVSGAPTEQDTCRRLIKRVSFIRPTAYGQEFQVCNKRDASNLAYTAKALDLHVDLCYYNYKPGIQMLHCLKRAGVSGGGSQFVDGLRAAEQVRQEAPHLYEILRTQEVDYRDVGCEDSVGEFHLRTRCPTIQYSKHGDFEGLNLSNGVRAPHMTMPVDKVPDLYRALKFLYDVMHRPDILVEHMLSEGEIATFNNRRVLHGRSAYVAEGASTRHLVGAYFDWDEAHSRLRVLREKLLGEVRL